MKPIIEIEHLSKRFSINHTSGTYLNIRDVFSNLFKRNTKEDFYALRDVSFNVMQGDAVGIMGKNGAGKSTLLKIISKITPPTSGSVTYRGRVASLLEVGTGFHVELSGRENVFMNGSILGMRNAEIKRNFDAIVDFAGIEKFIDTPLKHYSSGMQLRLAFAVAAFLENEILIIDEVLAVGDADFQRKCMGKMNAVSKEEGRTVLFVSHNMPAISALCKSGVVLKSGQVEYIGEIKSAIANYLGEGRNDFKAIVDLEDHQRERGVMKIIFKEITFNKSHYYSDSDFQIRIKLKQNDNNYDPMNLNFGLHIVDQFDNQIYHLSNLFLGKDNADFSESAEYVFTIPELRLKSGLYNIWLWLQSNGDEQDFITGGIPFEVVSGNVYAFPNSNMVSGSVQPEFKFTMVN